MAKVFNFFGRPLNLFVLTIFIGFIGHQFLQKIMEIHIPILDNYYDMFALGVILPWLYLWERRLFSKDKPLKKLSILYLILMTLCVGFITEVLFPIGSSSFVGDLWDVVVFGIGAMVFYLYQK